MDDECMAHLLTQAPPPMPVDLAWAPDSTSLSARCPVCGALCDVVYLDRDDLTVGCNHCIAVAYVHDYAWEVAQ